MRFEPHPSETARAASKAIMDAIDFEKKKGLGLSEKEDKVRRFILESFPLLGRAPTVEEASVAAKIPVDETASIFEHLNDQDIIYLKPGTHQIKGAYPFSNTATPHRVTIEGQGSCFAMCAVDALGAAFMFNSDTTIDSSCAQCGRKVHIEIKDGAILAKKEPMAVVWAGTKRCGPAATSICRTLLFMCTPEHLEKWRTENPGEGAALTLAEGLYVGRSVFKDFLRSL
ncbi:alkylmercury lyase [archaeon BMS3Abin16]|nr:alkylmercury lyase [archaeon BMS3Abin16]